MTLVKNIKKVIALVMCLITVFSVMSITASAASVSASLGYNEAENSGDYAYWNSSKVVKSSSTTKDEIKWMQAALNYCRVKEGLSSERLTVDGSFGPASQKATKAFQKAAGLSVDGKFGPSTIKKIKSILNDGKDNSLKPSTAATVRRPTATTTTQNITSNNNFKKQNILQVSASSSTKYISGNWYKYSRGNCSCCENKYNSEYGEHEYIQGGWLRNSIFGKCNL